MYQQEWNELARDPDSLAETYRFLQAIEEAKASFPAMRNHNQYLISTALMSAELNGFEPDVGSILAHTELGNSSFYDALRSMKDEKLVVTFSSPDDKRRKLIRATKTLIDQQIAYFDVVRTHSAVFHKLPKK